MSSKKQLTVLGAGSFGTALAHHLAKAGSEVVIWGRELDVLESIASENENKRYFPGYSLAPAIRTSSDIGEAVTGSSLIIFAVPSAAMREVAEELAPHLGEETSVLSTAKGLEAETLCIMSEVLAEVLGNKDRIAVLSGPSFAREVLEGLPTAVVVAGFELEHAKEIASYFHSGNFRVYTSEDVLGAELGGAFKNVIALAAGVVDGLQMGANARAALITRGLNEMKRLVVSLGGKSETVSGLSGLGDLLLTATGDLSRNRRVGLALGQGKKLEQILEELGQVAEGVHSAKQVLALAKEKKVRLPIVQEIVSLLSGKTKPQESAKNLLSREQTEEW